MEKASGGSAPGTPHAVTPIQALPWWTSLPPEKIPAGANDWDKIWESIRIYKFVNFYSDNKLDFFSYPKNQVMS